MIGILALRPSIVLYLGVQPKSRNHSIPSKHPAKLYQGIYLVSWPFFLASAAAHPDSRDLRISRSEGRLQLPFIVLVLAPICPH